MDPLRYIMLALANEKISYQILAERAPEKLSPSDLKLALKDLTAKGILTKEVRRWKFNPLQVQALKNASDNGLSVYRPYSNTFYVLTEKGKKLREQLIS